MHRFTQRSAIFLATIALAMSQAPAASSAPRLASTTPAEASSVLATEHSGVWAKGALAGDAQRRDMSWRASRDPDPKLDDLPVPAVDVTRSDTDLDRTVDEVAVLSIQPDGTPTVTKLRAESAADAAALAAELDARPGVVATRNSVVRAMDLLATEPMRAHLWHLPFTGAPAAWTTTRGAGVKVAVIDTGIDATHPDLAGRVLPAIDLLPSINPTPDLLGHGTRVASLIAGQLNSFGMAGTAPDATILPVAALDETGVGDTTTVASAIIAAANAGARVINLSLGGPGREKVLDEACKYAHRKGAVVVAAVGNTYQFGNKVQYPAASPHVLGVASVDNTGNPSAFSNTGSYVDIAAPGENIVAAIPGATFDAESGTSFAAPQVAATAALVTAVNPRFTPDQVIDLVTRTARDDASGDGRDKQVGFGILRADRAVAAAVTFTRTGLPITTQSRLRRFKAVQKKVVAGTPVQLQVQTQARWTKKKWGPDPYPVTVVFEFKAKGKKKFVPFVLAQNGGQGWAVAKPVPTKTGRWRAKMQAANGKWLKSSSQQVKVKKH